MTNSFGYVEMAMPLKALRSHDVQRALKTMCFDIDEIRMRNVLYLTPREQNVLFRLTIGKPVKKEDWDLIR